MNNQKFYENPIKKKGDFADPFVLKYNGRYYLYGTNSDIRCWSSIDLLHWELEGPTIKPETFPDLVPFAPEVVYWNGSFYMYTSPSSHGHYILKSDLPTGPFEIISENVGHNIDGTIFIDDNDEWYFYWADDTGILGCEMKSPTEFGEAVFTGAFMDGWTEGPLIIKKNSKYYMTYTGNHYLSSGYRINAAASEHPLYGYQDDIHNPIVINTEGKNIGLGHSSTVLGPDLMTHFIIYHNMNPDLTRDLNIDRQTYRGDITQIFGPTESPQPAPKMPDFLDYLNSPGTARQWELLRGNWRLHNEFYCSLEEAFCCINRQKTASDYVAEFNLKLCGQDEVAAEFGILFGWQDDQNYNKVVLSSAENKVKLIAYSGGLEQCVAVSNLPVKFDFHMLHCLRLVCDGSRINLYVDNRNQLEFEGNILTQGKLGYFSYYAAIAIGYTAFTNGNEQEAVNELYKPVPGEFLAEFALNSTKLGRSGYRDAVQVEKDASIDYNINVREDGIYTVDLFGDFTAASEMVISVHIDGSLIKKIKADYDSRSVLSFDVELMKGLHTLTLLLHDGNMLLHRLGFYQKASELVYSEPNRPTVIGPYGKAVWGDTGWSNGIIDAQIKVIPQAEDGVAGILLRTIHPSEGGEGKDTILGTNFFQGYFVGIGRNKIILSKHRYHEIVLETKEIELNLDKTINIRIAVKGNQFCVFINDLTEAVLCYSDPIPFTHGKVGIRAKNSLIELSELIISEI